MRVLFQFLTFAAAFLLVLTFSQSMMAQSTMNDWNKLVDEYFDSYFHFSPTAGTSAGFHQYDTELEDYSHQAVDAQIASSKKFLARFEQFDAKSLPLETRQDKDIVVSSLKATLLQLEQIRFWEKNPDQYSSGITYSAFVIMARKFAPPDERLRSLIAREKQMPAVFTAARTNLKNPPRIYTEVAIEQIPGIISFFQKDVPAAFQDVKDPKLMADFKQSNQAVITALERYDNFLKADLLPISKGDFRLGTDNYHKKVMYEEMVDLPLDRLLEIGYQDLRHNQEWFKKVAAQIDPKKTPQQILDQIQMDHPAGDKLLDSFKNQLGGLRDFIVQKHIVTIPSTTPPIVEETPPFMRALTSASMDTPGPYEKVAKEAFFNVTLPESSWPKKQIEEFMEGFNRGTILSTAIHEVYPGHYVQFLWIPSAPSKVRKLLGCSSNAEGWAHYTEQMMLDEGYSTDPKMRLGQLQDALLRDARFIVGISMHTGKMTFDQGIDFFVKEGYQTRAVATRETKRGTSDPTYLVYTVGKLEILKLREDYKQKVGKDFNLEQFHDMFLKQGYPPVKIIRETLLGNQSPVL